MKLVSVRDLRNRPGAVQEAVAQQSVALTSNGKPFALVIGVDADEDLAEVEAAVRTARAQLALSRLRRRAARTGSDRLTLEDVNAEIGATRSQRRRR
jgi:antitoxin (DNA-binding transcriptional repressor) of toxin-antitoxin stability system